MPINTSYFLTMAQSTLLLSISDFSCKYTLPSSHNVRSEPSPPSQHKTKAKSKIQSHNMPRQRKKIPPSPAAPAPIVDDRVVQKKDNALLGTIVIDIRTLNNQ